MKGIRSKCRSVYISYFVLFILLVLVFSLAFYNEMYAYSVKEFSLDKTVNVIRLAEEAGFEIIENEGKESSENSTKVKTNNNVEINNNAVDVAEDRNSGSDGDKIAWTNALLLFIFVCGFIEVVFLQSHSKIGKEK